MNKQGSFYRKISLILAAVFLLTVFTLPEVYGKTVSSSDLEAFEVNGRNIRAGDRIVIVSGFSDHALSLKSSDNRVDALKINISSGGGKRSVPVKDAAVFTVEDGGGYIYLQSDSGYLTSAEKGNGLYYSKSKGSFSLWQVVEGKFLYNVNARSASDGGTVYNDYYLEFYNGSFTTYGKGSGSKPDRFELCFFKIDESSLTDDGNYYLPVFETSDIHGYIADTDSENPLYLLSFISDKVKDVRGYGVNYRKDKALLLDGGDMFQGSTLSNLTEGNSVSAVFSLMDYDAVTVGNHEFDWGIENTIDSDKTLMDYRVGSVSGKNSVPVVASNIYHNGSLISFAYEYLIIEKTATDLNGNETDVKIAVIGFAGNYASTIIYDKFTGAGYSIRLDYSIANSLAASLESKGLCDATIVLAHENAEDIAEGLGKNSPVDLVLGGHTHQSESGVASTNIPYVQPASNGEAYSYCEMVFSMVNGDAVFVEIGDLKTVRTDHSRSTNVSGNKNELDPDVIELTDKVIDSLSSVLSERVGYITSNAPRYDYIEGSGERATVCGNWMASITARMVGADVGFVNNGSVRKDYKVNAKTGSLDITRADVAEMFPFNNNVYCYRIKYEELLNVLEYSLTKGGEGLLSRMWGIDCYYSGKTVNALVTKEGSLIYRNGKWTEGWKDKTLLVGVSEYIATAESTSEGKESPFPKWNDTDKLLSNNTVDSEGALRVLTEESKGSGGLLFIDEKAHYLLESQFDESNTGTAEPVKNTDKPQATPGESNITDPSDITGSIPPWVVIIVAGAAAIVVLIIFISKRKKGGR